MKSGRLARATLPALLLGLAGTAAFTILPATPANAQQRALLEVRRILLIAEGDNQSVFSVEINPAVGSVSTIETDPTKPSVALLGARRAIELEPTTEYRGLVTKSEIVATETGVTLQFTTRVPAKIIAEKSGDRRLLVTVRQLTGQEAIGSRPVGSEEESVSTFNGLPPALDPLPGEDGYELVMLKYADVSEIVGLLTDGVTVKPNNVFIRREPGFGSRRGVRCHPDCLSSGRLVKDREATVGTKTEV